MVFVLYIIRQTSLTNNRQIKQAISQATNQPRSQQSKIAGSYATKLKSCQTVNQSRQPINQRTNRITTQQIKQPPKQLASQSTNQISNQQTS
jgi:hypothetical protein